MPLDQLNCGNQINPSGSDLTPKSGLSSCLSVDLSIGINRARSARAWWLPGQLRTVPDRPNSTSLGSCDQGLCREENRGVKEQAEDLRGLKPQASAKQ